MKRKHLLTELQEINAVMVVIVNQFKTEIVDSSVHCSPPRPQGLIFIFPEFEFCCH